MRFLKCIYKLCIFLCISWTLIVSLCLKISIFSGSPWNNWNISKKTTILLILNNNATNGNFKIYTFFYVIKWLSYCIFFNSLFAGVKCFGIWMYYRNNFTTNWAMDCCQTLLNTETYKKMIFFMKGLVITNRLRVGHKRAL